MDVKTLCLGVLSRGDATGYEIRKQVTEGPFRYFFHAGYGSIYPALNQLSDDDLVTCTAMAQEKRPDKKVYSITATGRLALIQALGADPDPDRLRSDFAFMLFFGHLMSAGHLERVIGDRVAWYRDKIEHLEACSAEASDGPAGERFAGGLWLAICQAAADYLEENAHVLLREALLSERMVAE